MLNTRFALTRTAREIKETLGNANAIGKEEKEAKTTEEDLEPIKVTAERQRSDGRSGNDGHRLSINRISHNM